MAKSAAVPSLELRARLRAAGLRATSARVAVLGALAGLERPVSHGEVCDVLAADGFDRATVYRNLADLTEAGLVRRTDHGDHLWRFELVGRDVHEAPDPHPHFVCTECGSVECLPDGVVVVSSGKGAPKAIRTGVYEVQVRGACNACA